MKLKVIKYIITHQNPHLDELLAVWILKKYGRTTFNLLEAVWREIVTNELVKPWDQWRDAIFVGCGGSPYDEHGKPDADSSAQLVADELLSDHEYVILGRLIHIVGLFDRKTAPVKNPLPAVTKALFEMGKTVEEVAQWVNIFFEKVFISEQEMYEKTQIEVAGLGLTDKTAKENEFKTRFRKASRVWDQLSFEDCCKFIGDKKWEKMGQSALDKKQKRFDEAVKAIQSATITREFNSFVGRVKLVAVVSDNDQIGPASRKFGYDICIQKGSTGNVRIYTNLKRGIRLHKTAALIRTAELEAAGKEDHGLAFRYLMSEGVIKECPKWCLHVGAPNLYNGTKSYEAVEPTLLPLVDIIDIIVESLTPANRNVERSFSDNSMAHAFEKR